MLPMLFMVCHFVGVVHGSLHCWCDFYFVMLLLFVPCIADVGGNSLRCWCYCRFIVLLMVELVHHVVGVVSGGVGVIYHSPRYLSKPFPLVLFFLRIVLLHSWFLFLLHVFW
jgi:hypothetical protein